MGVLSRSRAFGSVYLDSKPPQMGKKCDVVYRRNKKESNIPQLIRYSLVKSILVEHMSVKEVHSS